MSYENFIDGYNLDVIVTEGTTYNSDITDNEVESGQNITDHIRNLPVMLNVEGIVSDVPIEPIATVRGVGTNPPADALVFFKQIWSARQPIEIITNFETYSSMVMQSLDITRDSTTGEALRFNAQFKQIRTVTNARTTVRVKDPRGAKKKKRGSKAVVEANPADKTKENATSRKSGVRDLSKLQEIWGF